MATQLNIKTASTMGLIKSNCVGCRPYYSIFLSLLFLLPNVVYASPDKQSIDVSEPIGDACIAADLTPSDLIAGLRVREIHINAGDLFDEQNINESLYIHSAANALHVATRRKTILQALPFRKGELLSASSLDDAERVLRSRRYLRSATVVPLERCGDSIDIVVRTVDNWSLTPSISLSSAGGVERYKIEVQDLNVLGLGKELTFRQAQSDGDRETTFVYGDDNVLGSYHRLRVTLGATESGDLYALSAGLPFVTSSTDKSWWFNVAEQNESLTLDEVGIVQSILFDAGVAVKLKQHAADVSRLGIGFRYERQRTTSVEDSRIEDITDFDEKYPYLYAQWAKSQWTEQRNFLGLGKVEDIDTGLGARIEVGLILDALGNNSNSIRISGALSQGVWTSTKSLHMLSLKQTHYVGAVGQEKFQLSGRYQYFRWVSEKNHLKLQIVADQQRGRSRSEDIELGGEFGLKGYRNGYQKGDTRLLSIAEFRHVTDWTPFSLLNLGWGVFAEAGKAWTGATNEQADTLFDVGAGFMFSPSRSTRNDIVRLDITFPLTDGEGVDSFLLYAGTQLKF